MMTQSTDPTSESRPRELSDDLPPVQPPSAGFIIQLFVVPGLIVLAVVAVWFAFGRITVANQDWQSRLQELHSPNARIRNNAMHGLADLLGRDSRLGEAGQQLSTNPEIAKDLSDLLANELKVGAASEESVTFQVYLSRALGYMDAPEIAFPVLRQSILPNRDVEVRKSAVSSIAVIASRPFEAGHPLEDHETVDALIDLSTDSLKLMRQTAAFSLAFFQSERADQQLHVLLGDSDQATAVNAAIALARRKNSDGLGVFKQALMTPPPKKNDELFQHLTTLTNVFKAITQLAPHMSEADRAEFRDVLKPLTTDSAEVRIRVDAQNALQSLK